MDRDQQHTDNIKNIRKKMRENKRRSLMYTLSICSGIIVILIVARIFLFDFSVAETNKNKRTEVQASRDEQIYNARIKTGKMYMQENDLASAADQFRSALEFNPQDVQANMLLAECYYRNCIIRYRHCNKAIDQFDRILDFDPTNAEVYFWLAKCQLRKRFYEGAIENFDKAIQYDPDNSNYYQARGALKMSMGDTLGALNDFDQLN